LLVVGSLLATVVVLTGSPPLSEATAYLRDTVLK
jgi:hypothetical protein